MSKILLITSQQDNIFQSPNNYMKLKRKQSIEEMFNTMLKIIWVGENNLHYETKFY